MASIRQSIRSSTPSKRPTSAIADGQIALNTASGTPGLFFKDNANNIIKVGPIHYGASAPNSSPAVSGSTGNSIGEAWLDSSLTPVGWKVWNGSAWVNATPLSSDTVQGLVELATNAETQAGVDTARAVTAAGLQSKVSDSTSTASSSGIASSAAVKTAYDLANAALPKSGGIITGNLEIGSTGTFTFEGSSADAFETTLAVVNPTADRTITFPNVTGSVVTTGDSGTVTSTMIADGTIVNADVSTTAAIAGTKISPNFGSQNIQTSGTIAIASGIFSLGSVTAPSITLSGDTNTGIYSPGADQLAISTSGATRLLVDASGNIGVGGSPSTRLHLTGSADQSVQINGSATAAFVGTSTAVAQISSNRNPTTGVIYDSGRAVSYINLEASPGNSNIQFYTTTTNNINATERMRITAAGNVGIGTSSPQAQLQVLDQIKISDSTQSQGSLQLGDGTSTTFNVGLARWNGSANAPGAAGLGYFSQGTGNSGGHYFYTGDAAAGSQTARMTIAPGGSVGIGTTSPGYLLTVSGGATSLAANQYLRFGAGLFASGDGTNDNYLFTGANGLSVRNQADTTERLRIDSSGRLLVGTSTARGVGSSYSFPIQNENTSAAGITFVTNSNDAESSYLVLGKSRGTSTGSSTIIQANDVIGRIVFAGADGTDLETRAATIEAQVDGAPGANDMPGRLVFSTTADGAASPTERMRINSSGLMTIGHNSGAGGVAVSDGTNYSKLIRDRIEFNTAQFYVLNSGSTGVILTNGSTAWAAQSDERFKTGLQEIDDGLNKIASLRAVTGRYLNEEADVSRAFLIAQDVQSVLPEAVSVADDEDGTLSLRYTEMIPLLVAALKESKKRIETLEARLSALESA